MTVEVEVKVGVEVGVKVGVGGTRMSLVHDLIPAHHTPNRYVGSSQSLRGRNLTDRLQIVNNR